MRSRDNFRTWIVAAVVVVGLFSLGKWFLNGSTPSADVATSQEATERAVDSWRAVEHSDLEADGLGVAPATVSGQVVTKEGGTIDGALVCMGGAGSSTPPRCVQAGRDGRFRFLAVRPGFWWLTAASQSWSPAIYRAEDDPLGRLLVTPGEHVEGIQIVLESGGAAIRGRVEDATGGPVAAHVDLRLDHDLDARFIGASIGTSTDEEGRFEFWGPAGAVRLRASAAGYGVAETAIVSPHDGVRIRLVPGSSMSGRVIDAHSGEPVAGARVRPLSGRSQSTDVAISDENGAFDLQGLPPGRYRPQAEADTRFGLASRSVQLGVGEAASDIVIELHPAGRVHATISYTGSGEASCRGGYAKLSPLNMSSGSRQSEVGTDSVVSFKGVLPGRYAAEITCPGGVLNHRVDELEVRPGQSIDRIWKVERGLKMTGHVRTKEARALREVQVVAVSDEGHMRHGLCDADGRFEITGLSPGSYLLRASDVRELHAPRGETTVEVKREDLSGVIVELPVRVVLPGRLVDEAGRAVADGTVVARDVDGGVAALARAAGDGSFRLVFASAGDYSVAASGRDASEEIQVSLEEGENPELTVVAPGGEDVLSGRVLGPGDAPVVDAFVTAVEDSASPGRSSTSVMTDLDGSFEIGGLAPGTYDVTASVSGAGEVRIQSVLSGTRRLELRLEQTAVVSGDVAGLVADPPVFTIALEEQSGGGVRRDTYLGASGAWTMEGIPPGSYVAYASAGASYARSAAFEVAAGDEVAVSLELEPFQRVRGRVVDGATREPVEGIRVLLSLGVEVAQSSLSQEEAVSDENGQVEVDFPASGAAGLTLYPVGEGSADYKPRRITLTPTDGSVGIVTLHRR